MIPKITISNDLSEAKRHRFDRFFRYNNSSYWLGYYSRKLKNVNVVREVMYADIISRYVRDGKKVVDLASGMGFLLKELYSAKLDVEGVDLFPEMIAAAKKYLGKIPVKIRQEDILTTSYKDSSLDAVVAESIIEHISMNEIEDNVMPEIKRILKKNGALLVHCPVRTPMSKLGRFVRRYIFKDLPTWAIDDDGDITHKIWLSPEEYIKLFEKHGFTFVNYDFWLTRSNMKPLILADTMTFFEKVLSFTDTALIRHFNEESLIIRVIKKIKGKLALTSYFLFIKK